MARPLMLPWSENGEAASAGPSDQRWWGLMAVLAVAAWYVYATVFHGAWLWDDFEEILHHPAVRDPAGLGRIWWGRPNPDYYPLTSSVQWLQWRLWRDHTLGYHLTNVGLHVVSAGLIWRLLSQLQVKMAWWGALLFVVHPVAVESVAWVAELKNALALPLLLLAFSAYVDFAASPPGEGRRHYAFSLVFFLASMLAKTSGVMFPVVVLLYAGWRRGRLRRSDLAAASGFLPISLILGLVTLLLQHRMGPPSLVVGGAGARLAGAGLAGAFYFCKCVFPLGLLPIYPRWPIAPAGWLPPVLIWAAGLGVAGWVGQNRRGWSRAVLLGGGFFFLNLVPVAGLLPMYYLRISRVADHFAYISLVGVVGLAAAGLSAWSEERAGSAVWRKAAVPAAMAVCCLLAMASRDYAQIFDNEAVLSRYVIRLNPGSAIAHNNLGVFLINSGHVPEALAEYREALRLEPGNADTEVNLATLLFNAGRTDEALSHYYAAMRLAPGSPLAHASLARALADSGHPDEALAEYRRALLLRPDFAEAFDRVGAVHYRAGRWAKAIAAGREAVRLDPGSAAFHNNLACTLDRAGYPAQAIAEWEQAVRDEPEFAEAQNNLGTTLVRAGQAGAGIGHLRIAVRLRPEYFDARLNLGSALLQTGRAADATPELAEAVRLRPSDATAQWILAESLEAAGRQPEAAGHYREAQRLDPRRGVAKRP